jgi:hypothetical protein
MEQIQVWKDGNVLKCKVAFGIINKFIRVITEYSNVVTLTNFYKDLTTSCYNIDASVPHNDLEPLIKHINRRNENRN